MFMFNLPPDPKKEAAIEARRNREKERKKRIFDVRTRLIGVDVEALNRQVEEKKTRETTEQSMEAAYGTNQVKYDLITQMLEKEEVEHTHQVAKNVQEFREHQQTLKTSHEFDLWDPDTLWKGISAHLSNKDSHCGPASLQCRSREDLDGTTHLRKQQEQLRHNLEKQIQEQQQARHEEMCADALRDKLRLAMDARAAQVAKLEESCRIAMRCAMANANKAQAAERTEQRRREHQCEQEANKREIHNQIKSDRRNEKTKTTRPSVAPQQARPRCWKNVTPDKQTDIKKLQKEQCREKEAQRQAEKALNAEWDNQSIRIAQAAMELEAQEKELCAEFQRGLGSFNQQLAKEQKAQHDYLNSAIYTSQTTAQYYLQFNTSSR